MEIKGIKFPDKLNILGYDYDVKYVVSKKEMNQIISVNGPDQENSEYDASIYLGYVDHVRQIIYIYTPKERHIDGIHESLWHEVVHAIINVAGIDVGLALDGQTEEALTTMISSTLYSVIKTNPTLIGKG